MKLLRLTSNNNNGLIETNFNEDIKIDENSQIALLNTSFSINKKEFTVSNFNNTIIYNDTDTSENTANLNLKTYSKADNKELLEDITNKLNSCLKDTQQNIGSQFLCSVSNGSTMIQNRICPNNGELFSNYTQGNLGKRTSNITVTKTTSSLNIVSNVATSDDSEYITTFSPLGKGNSSFRVRINKLLTNPANVTQNGFILGLSNTSPQNFTFTNGYIDQEFHFIKVNDLSENTEIQYKIIGGTETNSPLILDKDPGTSNAIPNKNYFNIDISEGKIRGRFYKDSEPSGTINELFSLPYNGTDDLYPFIVMRGDSTKLKLNNCKFFLDPYINDFSRYLNPTTEEDDGLLGARPVIVKNSNKTIKTLKFQSSDISQVLGFESILLNNQAVTRGEYKNISSNIYDLGRQNPYFIITSKNIDLESYDGDSKGRLNILYCFGDNTENTEESVFHEVNNPIFLNIKNSTAKSIRNLRFEVRYADLTRINNDGLISLCILIK